MGGIQAQYAPSMYIGLWSRLRDFERDALTRALERRTVVQATLMRVTIHLVSAADYWPLTAGVRDARRARWLKARPETVAGELRAAAAQGEAQAGRRPALARGADRVDGRPHLQRHRHVARPGARPPGRDLGAPAGGRLRGRGGLARRASATAAEGLELLIRRYLQGFGPGRARRHRQLGRTPAGDRERRRRGHGAASLPRRGGRAAVDLPRLPLPDADTPAPPRFLPTWDATLLVHCRRTLILPEEHRPKVFHTRTPQSVPTFMVDGAVAGKWRYERGRVSLEPFGRIAKAERKQLDAEAERLAAFHV